MDFVKKNPQIEWSGALSLNPNITMRDVLNNPQIQLNGYDLSINPNITMRDVFK